MSIKKFLSKLGSELWGVCVGMASLIKTFTKGQKDRPMYHIIFYTLSKHSSMSAAFLNFGKYKS